MKDDELRELASEGDEITTRRQVLQNEARILEESLRKCQQHRHRAITRFGKVYHF